MSHLPFYFDYAATTPLDPRVMQAMLPYLSHESGFGNPSSSHHYGVHAKEAVESARSEVARLLNALPEEIIWTSGATESNNLAIKGAAKLYQQKGKHIVTVKTEHPSVLETCQWLEQQGFSVTYLLPEPSGLVSLESFQKALREDTVLVSMMHVNNELGVIQDIASIAKITAARGILFHVDAAQSAGKIPIHLNEWPIDLLSLSAHKLYGPKGIGAVYVRKKPRVRLAAQLHGGGQEQGMRSGTLPTHQVVGMGEACRLARLEKTAEYEKILEIRNYFLKKIESLLSHENSSLTHSVPHILNVGFGVKAESLINALSMIAISSGSACHTKGSEPSYVLRALSQSHEKASQGIRFSFGRFTTLQAVDDAVVMLHEAVKKLR